jgi:hypothetical protein
MAVAVIASGPASAAPVELFSSSAPGIHAGAATVPGGICFVTIDAAGGAGGDNGDNSGGSGATVTARVTVTPGASLDAFVAGAGSDNATFIGGAGGIGGGGGGGADTLVGGTSGGAGGGGAVGGDAGLVGTAGETGGGTGGGARFTG